MDGLGMGPTELVIIMVITAVTVLGTWVPAIGIFRIARRAGYEPVVAAAWVVGYIVPLTSWAVPLGLGFIEWPRDSLAAKYPPPPPPPPQSGEPSHGRDAQILDAPEERPGE